MSALQAEVYRAFRTLNVDDDKALDAAVALSAAMAKSEEEALRNLKRVEDDSAKSFSKRDADIEAIRKDITSMKLDIVGIRGELTNMRWMGGVTIALVTTVLFRVFTH